MQKWIGLVLGLCLTNFIHAAIPATQGAYTERDRRKSILELNKQTLSGAYKTCGNTDPKWDAAAVTFLDAMAIRFSNAGATMALREPPTLPPAELTKLAMAATDAGCDDPMVAYCRAVILIDSGRSEEETLPIIERAVGELRVSKYPLDRVAAAAHREAVLRRGYGVEKRQAAWDAFRDIQIAAISKKKFEGVEQRIVLEHITSFLEDDGIEAQRKFAEAITAAPDVDPWIREMVLGRYETKEAWQARGGDWANNVTQQGWQEFFRRLALSRDHLVKAWEIQPKFPESAAAMIAVAMGGDAQLGEDTRKWFDRAVAAQLDYYPAYNSYLWSIRPRWGGSIEQMYAFGLECLSTKRFDTDVPLFLMSAVKDIAQDMNSFEFLKSPGVYENISAMCEGMAKQETKRSDWYKSLHAAFAWRAEKYDVARAQLDVLGDRFDPHAFAHVRALGRLAASHAYLMQTEAAGDVSKAEQRAAAHSLEDAILIYEAALKKLPAGDKAGYFLRNRLKQLQWQFQFESGEWIDIQPDRELAGWYSDIGEARVDDTGALIGSYDPDTGRFLLLWQAQFTEGNFEIEGKAEFPTARAAIGFVIEPSFPSEWWGFYLGRKNDKICFVPEFLPKSRADLQHQPVNSFQVSVNNFVASVVVNDKQLIEGCDLTRWLQQPKTYLGIGGKWTDADATVKVTGLRIRNMHPTRTATTRKSSS